MWNNAIYGPLNFVQLHVYKICGYMVVCYYYAHVGSWTASTLLAKNDNLRIQKEDQKYKIPTL